MADELYDVVGIGNAILDVLAHSDDEFLRERGLAKGSMRLIDEDQAALLYAEMGAGVERSGGSAANSMVGIASLGGTASFIGKVHDDALGRAFRRDIRASGVAFETEAAESGPPTGRCLVLVTPDAQRTMNTYLGAAANLGPEDIDPATVERARVTYLEGYLYDPPPAKDAFLKAAEIAHGAGRKVALSLSDSFCVERHRAEFRNLVKNHADILFANETEIISLFETSSFDEAMEQLRGSRLVAALTRGEKGSVIVAGDRVLEVDPAPVSRVLDTTGAGDLYAAGFLYGLTRDRDLETCGRLGGIAAAEIISHVGARPETSLAELVRSVES